MQEEFPSPPDPKIAVWQHLNYYFRHNIYKENGELAKAHRAAHQEKKKRELSSNQLTGI